MATKPGVRFKRCPLSCRCLCHSTQGGVHPHHGEPCPGKAAQRAEHIMADHRERTSGVGEGFCVACREKWPCEPYCLATLVLEGKGATG